MFEPILNRVKAGMSLEDCIVSIAGGNYELSIAILDACDMYIGVWPENSPHEIILVIDAMRIYDDDLFVLYDRVCGRNIDKFLIILWSYEIGFRRLKLKQEVPELINLSLIKSLISNAKEGKDVEFPFEEAKRLLRSSMRR